MSLSLLFLVLLLRPISKRLISLERSLRSRRRRRRRSGWTAAGVKHREEECDSLEDELLGEHGVLTLPRVSPGHLHAVQVDVAVRAGEILDGQLMGLLHVQHQAADLMAQEGNKKNGSDPDVKCDLVNQCHSLPAPDQLF